MRRKTGLALLLFLLPAPVESSDQLEDILSRVESYAPAVKAARADARAGDAGVRRARSRYAGEVDLFVRDSHFDDDRLVEPLSPPIQLGGVPFDSDQIGYGVVARLPLDVNGRIGADVRGGRALSSAARADVQDVRLRLLNDAASLYRGLQRTAGRRDALDKQLEALEVHVDVADAAVRVGRIARVESLRLQAERARVRAVLAELDGTDAALRARLAVLMGADRFDERVAGEDGSPVAPLQGDDSAERPDLESAAARVEAARAGVRAARAERLPGLSLDGHWEQNRGYSGAGGDSFWDVLLNLRLPVWDGKGRRWAVRRAGEQQQSLEYRLAGLRDTARAEVNAAQARWNAAEIRHEASMLGLSAAEETARIQSDRFAAGRLSAADLVDAEAALAGARSDLTAALAAWWQADDAWRLSLGLPPAAYVTSADSGGSTP